MLNLKHILVGMKGEAMKQNFKDTGTVKGKEKEVNNFREVTVKDMFETVLLKKDEVDSPEEILVRYRLLMKIKDVDEIGLSETEKDLLKKLICRKYEVLFAGQVLELLN